MKFYHILLSLGIGALLNYIIINLMGFVGADTSEIATVLIAFIICILVYVLFYLHDIRKTLTKENQQLKEEIGNLRKKVDAASRQGATNEDVHEVYVKICELQEQISNNKED